MIILEHVFVGLQIEVRVVLRVLAEADCTVLVYNTSNFNHMAL